MPFEIVTIPCLSDNYAYLVHDPDSGVTALVDAPEPTPILAALADRGWTLSEIWLTHHHWDHVDGLPKILAAHPAMVTGAAADEHRLPALDRAVKDGDNFTFAGEEVRILDVSGHTIGHIAFYLPETGAAFTADSLMAMGCGRLFEGTPAQMYHSLSKLATLPADTLIYSGHEYTASNIAFAVTIDSDNAALQARAANVKATRTAGQPTVPSLLSLELATNPFLRCDDAALQNAIGMSGADPVDVFTEVRKRKDNF